MERLGCAVKIGWLPPTRERRPFLLHRHFYHSAITLPAPKSSSSAPINKKRRGIHAMLGRGKAATVCWISAPPFSKNTEMTTVWRL